MNRKIPTDSAPSWVKKLDSDGRQLLTAYKLKKEIQKRYKDSDQISTLINAVRTLLPGSVGKEDVEISQLGIEALKSAGLQRLAAIAAKKQKLPVGTARFFASVEGVAALINDSEFRRLIPVAGAFVLLIFQQFYDDIVVQNFGTLTPTLEQASWAVGTILIATGQILKGRKELEFGKGRANAELLEIIRLVRKHETKKIMPKEMKQIMDHIGIHVTDAESLRLFEWRAKKRRQL